MHSRRIYALAPALAVLALLLVVLIVAAQNGEPAGIGVGAGSEANVTPAFTYQGYLEDGSGPANGSHDFKFKLFDSVSGCCQVGGTVSQNGVSVVDGLFTVGLDYGADAFDGAARWLQICVAPAGDPCATLSPRQPLNAAPYAHSLRPGAVVSGSVGIDAGVLNLYSDHNGLVVERSGQDGALVNSAGWSGFSVQEAGGNGLYVGTVGQSGVLVEGPAEYGLRVYSTTRDALLVEYSGLSGLSVNSAGEDGVYVGHANEDGLYVSSVADDGVDVAGEDLAGYFFGDVAITGSCTGCVLANFGVNAGDQPLRVGDLVALQAIHPSGVDASPVLLEVMAARSADTPIGVVVGAAELIEVAKPRADESGQRLVPREADSIAPGGFVTIVFAGIVQVRAGALESAIAAGDRLAVGANGLARPLQTRELDGMVVSEGAPVVGIALEGLDAGQEGLIWLLVDLQ